METKHLRVLVVEDHLDIRNVLGMVLKSLGHQPTFAVDVGSALGKAADEEFDVLLTDIGLPGRDGWDLLRALAARGQLPVHAISMSAGGSGEESARSRAAGCQAHLIKPFRLDELEAALQKPSSPAHLSADRPGSSSGP